MYCPLKYAFGDVNTVDWFGIYDTYNIYISLYSVYIYYYIIYDKSKDI